MKKLDMQVAHDHTLNIARNAAEGLKQIPGILVYGDHSKDDVSGVVSFLHESLHAEDIHVEYIIRDGKPNKVICEQAEKKQADLIIMGVYDKNIMTNIIFRSTASFVIEHVNIPVLVVPMKNK